MAGDLPSLPGWEADDDPALMQAAIEAASKQLQQKDALGLFRKRSLLGFTLLANKLEGTLPEGFDDPATYQLMEELLARPFDCTAELQGSPKYLWPAEGHGSKADSSQQVIQFLKAARYLCWPLQQPLTVDAVCTAHKLLMWGAVEDGVVLPAGEFRSTPAFSGTGYMYPDAGKIPERLLQVVNNFNGSLRSGTVPSYQLAADLLYQFVALHPFPNGNGRLCRLLAAYAAGVPFLLHLSNGHTETRQHYHYVLRHADKRNDSTLRLQSYILEFLHLQWCTGLCRAASDELTRGLRAIVELWPTATSLS